MNDRIHVPAFDRTLMTCRVYWMATDGGEPGDGAWFWVETEGEGCDDVGEPFGPFETAIDAGRAARAAVVKRSSAGTRE